MQIDSVFLEKIDTKLLKRNETQPVIWGSLAIGYIECMKRRLSVAVSTTVTHCYRLYGASEDLVQKLQSVQNARLITDQCRL